jgi:hypothetical protein
MATRATKVAGAAIASAVVATGATVSEGVTINESTLNSGINEPFPGATVPVANTFASIEGSVFENDDDFFNYQGLQPGSSFDILVELFHDDLSAQASSLVPTSLDSVSLDDVTSTGNLTGIVPSDGHVVVHLSTSATFDTEGYRITLRGTRASVPVPASLALVTAGLVALGGLHVARRRRAA